MAREKNIKCYKICVVGAGHVGLVAAACFAQMGHKVICVDNDEAKISSLNKLVMPFYEPGMRNIVKINFRNKRLVFSHGLAESIRNSEVIFIAVGTPPQEDGLADLTAVENVARTVADNINSYKLVIEKSTVPVQTGIRIKETITRYSNGSKNFDVASNPEFLREGKAVYDFFNPERIILGVESKKAEKILKNIYGPFKVPVIVTDINTSELIKHASNSFLAMKISFINAVSRVCDLSNADIDKVSQAMGLDKRIGGEFLRAGIGYGGFCFPKDVEAFIGISKKLGYSFDLLKAVKDVNDRQGLYFAEKIKDHLWVLKGKKIAVLGVSFKPDTDDIRFAPSLGIINYFINEGMDVAVFDPKANEEAKSIFGEKARVADSPLSAVKGADCLCFLTEWDEFKRLDFKKVKKMVHYPLIADGRNMFDKRKILKLGFEYIGVGR